MGVPKPSAVALRIARSYYGLNASAPARVVAAQGFHAGAKLLRDIDTELAPLLKDYEALRETLARAHGLVSWDVTTKGRKVNIRRSRETQ